MSKRLWALVSIAPFGVSLAEDRFQVGIDFNEEQRRQLLMRFCSGLGSNRSARAASEKASMKL